MKKKNRPIKVYIDTTNIDNLLLEKNILQNSIMKIDFVDYLDNGYQYVDKTEKKYLNNIFSIYDENLYEICIKIKEMLISACNDYQVVFEKQKYYLHGSYFEYNESTNFNIYDFPQDIPIFHGFYVINTKGFVQTYKTDLEEQKINLKSGDITLSAPTNKINCFSDGTTKVIEFYLSPLSLIKEHIPAEWFPIGI